MEGPDACDVTGIQPTAREIVRTMGRVYVTHLGSALSTLVAHGSAVRGGVIPRSSDVDIAAFVDPAILDERDELPLEQALRLHEDLARIDPAPFRYLQGHIYRAGQGPPVGFIPGTFHVVWGEPGVPLADQRQVVDAARCALGVLDPDAIRSRISNALLDHGEGRLDRQVRWLCTDVWPVIYQVACLNKGDGMEVWRLTKQEVVGRLQSEPLVGLAATAWFETVTAHYATGEALPTALQAIRAGMAMLDAAKVWTGQRFP
jgi:hypothetical protein